MISRLKIAVGIGAAILLAVIAAGAEHVVRKAEDDAWRGAATSLERSAGAVENALNRQLLQVDGALASLQTLFGATNTPSDDPARASHLLRGLNFQTLAFRDLMLVAANGRVVASARSRGMHKTLSVNAATAVGTQAAVIGPIRSGITGDWSLYIARAMPAWDGLMAVAEVPLPVLMKLLAETGVDSRVRLALQRSNGQLIATLPHDEMTTGTLSNPLPADPSANGVAFVERRGTPVATVKVARASLYSDIHVVLAASSDIWLADWRRDSQRTILVAAIVGFLITAFAAALLVALRQHERIDAERLRSAKVLADAIEAMADGFVMWDRDDRLVTCNRRYRDLYVLSAPFMTTGATFEDIIRQGAQAGQYPQAGEDLEAFVQECIASHRQGPDSLERLLPDGRWLLITERRMVDGGIVGIRTDITALKQAHADLSAASARANEAVEEAQRQNAALVEQEARISFLAHHDDLTGLHNRLSFRTHMMAALARAAVENQQIAILFLDLDRFKDVNDTLGHPVGDKLLRLVAQRLSDCVSSAEPIARLGGDEFAIISMNPAQPYGAEQLSARVIAAVREPYSIDGHNIALAASVGIAVSDGAGTDADDLLKQADLALYRAKSAGGGSFCIFADEMGEHLSARLEMVGDLRQALADHRLELAYQPIFDLRSSQLWGFEALLRWHHPVRGFVSPADFIPLAEETRLIVGIGDWVIRQACTDALRLPGAPHIAVNISPVQLAFGDIVATVTAVLEETGLPAARLELEITETALFTNDSRNLEALRLLRQLGVRVVLDDFGTGYSSLSHLRLCPLDKIKIDRSFVHDMTDRSDSAAIVSAIASLAAELGMRTTAEGIESLAQLEAVRAAGCTQAQGFFLGKPQPLLSAIHTAASAAVPLWKSTQRAGKVTAISQ